MSRRSTYKQGIPKLDLPVLPILDVESAPFEGGGSLRNELPGMLLVVCGPSGTGKTSLVHRLTEHEPSIYLSISHTTRPRRSREIDAQDYHFVDLAIFETMVAREEMLEHAQVFGHHYGTSRAEVMRQLAAGIDVILEIDWQGARQIRERFPECVTLEILPPSLSSLEERLEQRAQDNKTTIARRMRDAVEEISHFQEFDYLVINEDFQKTSEDLIAIVKAERLRLDRQTARHRHHINELLSAYCVKSTVS